MTHLILVRHGQSEWNLEKRFTGWVDVDLTGQGKLEACKAGEYIKKTKIDIDYFYSSFQLRAISTLKFIQDTLRDKREPVKAWQLNERHYGALTGLNKDEMKEKLGEDKIHAFRRSWDIKPDPLSRNNPYHPLNIEVYKNIPKENIPDTESLKDTYERVMKFYVEEIQEKLNNNENIVEQNLFLNNNTKNITKTPKTEEIIAPFTSHFKNNTKSIVPNIHNIL